MPFTYSIAYGLITGIITYTILNSGAWIITKASSGRIMPHDYEQKDYWTYKVRGGLLPGWVKRAARGKKDFWREWDFDSEELTSRDSYAMKKDRSSGMSVQSPGVDGAVTGDRNWEMPVLAYGVGGIPLAGSSSRS
jgi:AGZA family xanthine/uracil permease-like MFS transporter